ncbi:hypothetical protein FIBSPDRAFT_864410 [Athelia psychrophila]|uniref:Uncharacterized protein n=1 Tax=Athelia psychrophila TaxID=1759441 RepID=A0A166GG89_9AGAM|nr:hypothetical protein FIBSPDRAFT_864410 [Fibularhizoctonia sp. CBS 109695]
MHLSNQETEFESASNGNLASSTTILIKIKVAVDVAPPRPLPSTPSSGPAETPLDTTKRYLRHFQQLHFASHGPSHATRTPDP